MNEFYDEQTDLTAAKILIYGEYLRGFLHTVLMKFRKCYIADLFCGCGKNGTKDGSPAVLLRMAKEVLNNPVLLKEKPNAEIEIIFNDQDKTCVDNLAEYIKGFQDARIKITGPHSEEFDEIKNTVLKAFEAKSEPKFIFLDPFTYSSVKMEDVKAFMGLPAAEVLLFLPTFHSYRFSACDDMTGKLKDFIEGFTDKGFYDYGNINTFNESIGAKLREAINLQYVRPIGLDGGASKNALFYMTTHIKGMMIINKLVWK